MEQGIKTNIYYKINFTSDPFAIKTFQCVAGDRFKEGFVVAMKEVVDAWSAPKKTVIIMIILLLIVFIIFPFRKWQATRDPTKS